MTYDPERDAYNGPVWDYFGLTYSSYLVLPRRMLCSLPRSWQARFVALLEEAEAMLPEEAQGGDYMVRRRERGRFVSDPNIPYRHAAPWPLKAPS
jgi:hypothetical protein